jgi:beta-N-acetylhexosaminidase
MPNHPIKAAIIGVAGVALTDAERLLYRQHMPFGFILFRRNCVSPDQMRMLVHELCEVTGRADTPILIDQEGGRVARLRAPVWTEFPPAAAYGRAFATDEAQGRQLAAAAGRLMGEQMRTVGCTVNCAPMVDVASDGAHSGVMGDRTFADNPHAVAALSRAYAEGLRAAGVLPVIKHLPGHGRATADSHVDLPVVAASREQLAQTDFAAFQTLADLPLGMTAHVLFPAIDAHNPATLSPTIITDIIRGHIGFDGLLMTDDLDMNALTGSFADRTTRALAAGNDVVLCGAGAYKGDYVALAAEVLQAAGTISPAAVERWGRAKQWLATPQKGAPAPMPALSYPQLMAGLAPFIHASSEGPSHNSGDSLVASV